MILDIKIYFYWKGGTNMSEEIKFTEVKSEQDYMNLVYSTLYTPENIEAAGGIENFTKLVEEGKRHSKSRMMKSKIMDVIESVGSKLLAVALIVGIIIVVSKIL